MRLLPPSADLSMLQAMMPRFLRRNSANFQRRYERYACSIPGTMTVLENGARFDGLILEISAGGCSFRPASHYMLNRVGSEVVIGSDEPLAHGVIRATRPHSYGIEFPHDMSPEAMAALIARYYAQESSTAS